MLFPKINTCVNLKNDSISAFFIREMGMIIPFREFTS
jgi:hypothetical protein